MDLTVSARGAADGGREASAEMKRNPCELLVPVGGTPQMIAAVENGADAVYLGGSRFNARMQAGNFDDETLQAAIDFAHCRGVRVYVTLNTLLDDDQLQEALDCAAFCYAAGADALIVQDLGLGMLLREQVPDLPLHLSTQGTVYDLRGVEAAHRLGYRRVVLARELSLEEIREICAGTETEIEVFVHGALCFCYSGQCQLSRCFGGRSGNRGQCAQPCRLPYQTLYAAGRPRRDMPPYPLSPKDLCALPWLGDLAEAGVRSLKIEGRMKSAAYVAVVTSIYRKYLDLWQERGTYTVDPADLQALAQVFNRGGFTDTYLRGDAGDVLLSGDLPKHRGVAVGTVVRGVPGTPLADLQMQTDGVPGAGATSPGNASGDTAGNLSGAVSGDASGKAPGKMSGDAPGNTPSASPGNVSGDALGKAPGNSPGAALQIGDVIEIHGKTVSGNRVTYCEHRPDGRLRIGDIKRPVRPGDRVFRLVSAAQQTAARATFADKTFAEGAFLRRTAVDLAFRCMPLPRGAHLCLQLQSALLPEPVEVTLDAEELSAGETGPDRIAKALRKTGGTPFAVRQITCDGQPIDTAAKLPYGIPVALVNRLRREGIARLQTALCARRTPVTLSAYTPPPGEGRPVLEWVFYSWKEYVAYRMPQELADLVAKQRLAEVALVPLPDFMAHRAALPTDRRVIPYITAVSRGKEDRWITAHFDEIVDCVREIGVYVGNLSWIAPFRQAGVPVYGDAGLNITNGCADAAYRSLGVRHAVRSLETMDSGLGAFPLMYTAHVPAGTWLLDRKKERLRILKRTYSDQAILCLDGQSVSAAAVQRALAQGTGIVRLYPAPAR